MADVYPWVKLWTSALDDPDLDNLSLDDWARWVKLLLYVRRHGNHGEVLITSPATTLCSFLKVNDFSMLQDVLKRLPGIVFDVKNVHVTGVTAILLHFRNLNKWQQDMSRDRVAKHRDRMKRLRRDETRREITDEKRGALHPPLSPQRGDVTSIGQVLKDT